MAGAEAATASVARRVGRHERHRPAASRKIEVLQLGPHRFGRKSRRARPFPPYPAAGSGAIRGRQRRASATAGGLGPAPPPGPRAASGVDGVGEQHNRGAHYRCHQQRGARKTCVPDGAARPRPPVLWPQPPSDTPDVVVAAGLAGAHRGDRLCGQHAPSLGRQQHLNEGGHLPERGEQTGVAGYPAQRMSVAVVHLSPDEARREPLVAVQLSGGNAPSLARRGAEPYARYPQGAGDAGRKCLVHPAPVAGLEYPAQEHVAEVRIADGHARDRLFGLRQDGRFDRLPAAPRQVEGTVVDQACRVREQVPQGRPFLGVLRQPPCDRVVEVQCSPLAGGHCERDRAHDLGQRGEVVGGPRRRGHNVAGDARVAAEGLKRYAGGLDQGDGDARRETLRDKRPEIWRRRSVTGDRASRLCPETSKKSSSACKGLVKGLRHG